MGVSLTLMDRARIERNGQPVEIDPASTAVLIRLLIDSGRFVRVYDLGVDALPPLHGSDSEYYASTLRRRQATRVHKCISVIRRALDPDHPGRSSKYVLSDIGQNSGYRLQLPPHTVDILLFEELVLRARSSHAAEAVVLLERAIGMWRGNPLIDVAHLRWARPRIDHLTNVFERARRSLFELYLRLDRWEAAIALGERILRDHPDEGGVLDRLREVERKSNSTLKVSRRLVWPDTEVNVTIGDLFEQDDAHLVVGFNDLFETNTANDRLVSRFTVQGQLLTRCYGGDHRRLDGELRRALRGSRPHVVESRMVKKYGKLTRYPIGTVAVLEQDGRRIFAVAYSSIGTADGRAQSSVPALTYSLGALWAAIREHGQHRPVALPILGSGLARIYDLDRHGLLELIVRSFVEQNGRGRLTDELRIMLHPDDVGKMDPHRIDELLRRC